MRTEELINEAKSFKGDFMAYIHCEIFNGKQGAAIVTGDDRAILIAAYGIIESLAEQDAEGDEAKKNREIKKYIKAFKTMHKKSMAMGRSVFDTIQSMTGGTDAD